MAGKKKLMITDQRIIHLLRHFSEIDFSYRSNLYALGLDDLAIKAAAVFKEMSPFIQFLNDAIVLSGN